MYVVVAGARDWSVLDGQNFVLHDRCRIVDACLSRWQAWYFVHVAQTLAGMGRFEMRGTFGLYLSWQAQQVRF